MSSLVLFFLSADPFIASSLLPLYFMVAAVVALDLEEIKNLCCFVALPCGLAVVNKVVYYGLPHALAQSVLKIKSIHS